jgi:hypothetical protein
VHHGTGTARRVYVSNGCQGGMSLYERSFVG